MQTDKDERPLNELWDGKDGRNGRMGDPIPVDFAMVRKHADKYVSHMFDRFETHRAELTQLARHFYPLGVQGLVKGTDDGRWEEDEDRVLHYTPKPVKALEKGASGFLANLTSPSTKWFELKFVGHDDALADSGAFGEKVELDKLTDVAADVMRNANLYSALHKVYTHCLCFGFACMLVTGDEKRIVKATTLRVGTYALGVDGDGQVNRVARKFTWNAEEIVKRFGRENVPERVLNAVGKPRQTFRIVNLIEPHDPSVPGEPIYEEGADGERTLVGRAPDHKGDPVSDACGLAAPFPYRSVYYLDGGGSRDGSDNAGVLEIRGFRVNPIVAPRYDTEIGDVYGKSPAHLALATARKVQSCEADRLRISSNNAEPPVIVAASLKSERLNLKRGGVTHVQQGEQRDKAVYPIFPQGVDPSGVTELEMEGTQDLSEIFFNSVFATINELKNQKGVKTATEISALVRENLELLGAVVMNFDRELLDPFVTTVAFYVYHAMQEDGAVDPEVLDFIKVNYVSKVHMALKQTEMSAIEQSVAFVAQLTQLEAAQAQGSRVVQNLDLDKIARAYATMVGLDAGYLRDFEEIGALREQEAEARAEQERMAQAQQAMQIAKDAGSIPTDGGHAGGKMMEAMEENNEQGGLE